MEILYENKYTTIYFNKKKDFVKMVGSAETTKMSEEEYRKIMLKLRDSILEKKVKYALLDNREFHFVISPSIQDWTNSEVVAPAFQSNLVRVAFIESKDLFANISSQQTMEDNDVIKKPFRYFDNEYEAMNWLFNQ